MSSAPVAGFNESELLRLAASLERGSEHPLAAAIVAGAQERGIDLTKTQSFDHYRQRRYIYNSIGVPIAAGVLYPFFGLLLSPMIAAAAMSFSSVSVIANDYGCGAFDYNDKRF